MNPTTRFKVELPDPSNHIIQVSMEILALGEEAELEVFLPVWTPGSYVVREYAQYVSTVRAFADDNSPRTIAKKTKSSWVVKTNNTTSIRLEYSVYGYNLNVRYNHVDASHAFVHGPATFFYVPSRRDEPVDVDIVGPADWNVCTGLTAIDRANGAFRAKNFDELYDCPFEIGPHEVIEFEAYEKPHRMVFWSTSDQPLESRIADDTKRIVETAAAIFGGTLPYESYRFITLLTESSFGGLEHRNSTALMFPRSQFREAPLVEGPAVVDDKYYDFLALVSHEFFHVWNVKRIKPDALSRIDYQGENYTRDLWTIEGITSYYDELILLRAGLISPRLFLDKVATEMTRLQNIPGRLNCSLEASSFDAWIGLYRPDPHNHNGSVSYYLKGSLISLILDLMIRVDTEGRRSLDDVMAYVWHHYGRDEGYAEGAYEEIVEEVIGHEVGSFFDDFIRGTAEPNWAEWFENLGLDVSWEDDENRAPNYGFKVDDLGKVTHVDFDGPAVSNISPGDELIAINHEKLAPRTLDAQIRRFAPGDTIDISFFRNGRLMHTPTTLAETKRGKFVISRRKEIDVNTATLLKGWLGTDEID